MKGENSRLMILVVKEIAITGGFEGSTEARDRIFQT